MKIRKLCAAMVIGLVGSLPSIVFAELLELDIVPGTFPAPSSVSATIDGGIIGVDSDSSSISGTVTMELQRFVEPFGAAKIVDMTLVLDDGFDYRLALGALRASAAPGAVVARMVSPGEPSPLIDNTFSQNENLFALDGTIDVSVQQGTIDLSEIDPQPFDISDIKITANNDRISADVSLELVLEYDVEDVPVFGTIPITIALVGSAHAVSQPISVSLPGDFDRDGQIGLEDINALTRAVRSGQNDMAFDLNNDGMVDSEDRRVWVEEIRRTYFGDSNLDGEFNSGDFVLVFQASEYEDGLVGNSLWETGDWNGDGEFDTSDFVLAFTAGGFEKGPRALPIPEPPFAVVPLLIGIVLWFRCRPSWQIETAL